MDINGTILFILCKTHYIRYKTDFVRNRGILFGFALHCTVNFTSLNIEHAAVIGFDRSTYSRLTWSLAWCCTMGHAMVDRRGMP